MALVSVEQYNKARRLEKEELERRLRLTGVACPACGTELVWYSPFMTSVFNTLQTFPSATRKAKCYSCTVEIDLES